MTARLRPDQMDQSHLVSLPALLSALEGGSTRHGAAAAVGVDDDTLQRWLRDPALIVETDRPGEPLPFGEAVRAAEHAAGAALGAVERAGSAAWCVDPARAAAASWLSHATATADLGRGASGLGREDSDGTSPGGATDLEVRVLHPDEAWMLAYMRGLEEIGQLPPLGIESGGAQADGPSTEGRAASEGPTAEPVWTRDPTAVHRT
jgi:hypothetical protein